MEVWAFSINIKNFLTMYKFFQVSTVLNGMLDQSFKDRAVHKQHGVKLAAAIMQNWRKCDSWWAADSAPESKVTVLSLLAKMLQVF